MNPALIPIAVIAAMALLVLALKVWNYFSRRYNHKILRNSHCKNCAEMLNSETFENALRELEKEREQFKNETKIARVKLLNMKLICQNCGTENHERDLYQVYRESRNSK